MIFVMTWGNGMAESDELFCGRRETERNEQVGKCSESNVPYLSVNDGFESGVLII